MSDKADTDTETITKYAEVEKRKQGAGDGFKLLLVFMSLPFNFTLFLQDDSLKKHLIALQITAKNEIK